MRLIEYPDRELMMIDLADTLASGLKSVLLTHETASFCVPGGTTPGPIFDVLSGVDLDWPRISVFLSDERWVPEDSPRSNTRLLKERLLTGKAAGARYLPLYAPTAKPEEAIPALGEAIEACLPISVLLLGMGADMHTASLFPGADGLTAALADDAPVLVALRPEGADEPRVSLSARVLRDAMNTHVVITGTDKREALDRAQQLPPHEAPIRAVLGNATVHWAE